ncbi:hypothetical protein GCM10022221_67860 [Actinocorallia aurea]
MSGYPAAPADGPLVSLSDFETDHELDVWLASVPVEHLPAVLASLSAQADQALKAHRDRIADGLEALAQRWITRGP